MKAYVQVEYKNKVYIGDSKECTASELETVSAMVKLAAEGKVNSLTLTKGNIKRYFPVKMLKKSVISIITE